LEIAAAAGALGQPTQACDDKAEARIAIGREKKIIIGVEWATTEFSRATRDLCCVAVALLQ